jgi:hypothetical protein
MMNEAFTKGPRVGSPNRIASLFWIALLAVLAISTFNVLAADEIVLAWDPNNDTETAGYYLHTADGAGRPLSKSDMGSSTTATVSGLLEGNTYTFFVSAYDSEGLRAMAQTQSRIRSCRPILRRLQTARTCKPSRIRVCPWC